MLRALAAAVVVLAVVAPPAAAQAPDAAAVAKTYADIAEAGYTDSLAEARKLKTAIDTLIKTPTEANLLAARKAWVAARVPYMQTEAFRFGNKIVDDWEPRVNSWPLDEGLIDYVSHEYVDQSPANDLYVANVIANPSIKIGGEPVDTSKITKELLVRQAAGGGRRREQRRDRLSRHRVPAVGSGSQRHRPRRRQSPGDRLRREELHAAAIAIAAPSISRPSPIC